MEGTEVRKLAALEDTHWWYRERRHLLARAIARADPRAPRSTSARPAAATRGCCATLGWSAAPLEYGADGARVARRARPGRGARRRRPRCRSPTPASTWWSPSTSSSTSSTTTPRSREVLRVLRPGGTVPGGGAVPTRGCGPPTTRPSATSVATPATTLRDLLERNGFERRVGDARGTCCCGPSWRCAAARAAAATSRTCTRWSTWACARSSPSSATCRCAALPGVTLLVPARRP